MTFYLFYAIIADDMERVWSTSHRGFSVRSILTFVLTVFIAALLWVSFGPQANTQAIDGFDATWKGDSLMYNGAQYYPATDAKAGESHGLTPGTQYFMYVEEIEGTPKTQRAHIIYFAPGADPPTTLVATYIHYDYSSSKVFSNPQGKQDIDVIAKGEESSYSSCAVDGIGWIICPVAVFLADGMDNIFEQIKGFVEVQPSVLNDPNNDLYIAWNIMRTIANIAFIIVFLIIIYSQVTSLAISNYGLKKLLPRLIIAAILVNLSFIITAIAVDLSNILGYSLQDIFIQIRQDTFNIDNDTWSAETTSWANLTGFILSGGAITGGIIALSIATGGSVLSAIYLLLPLLVGLILTILFVLLILAARQAIIIILIVIAPLAFVAYLLPNTEGWFKKWRDLFMTMLIFFPAFSLVFGGSQLAGGIILQNADDIFTMIFGLAVQVAPLVITPLLLKLSGGLLGRIAGIVNDPRKGLLDRTKNWSNSRAEMRRYGSLQKTGGANPFRRVAQRFDDKASSVKNRTSQYQMANENRYHSSDEYGRIHTETAGVEMDKEQLGNRHKSHISAEISRRGTTLNVKAAELENSKVLVEEATANVDAMYAEMRAGKFAGFTGNQRLERLQASMSQRVINTATTKQRAASAQIEQQQIFAQAMKNSVSLQNQAGGILEHGSARALASATATIDHALEEAIKNIQSTSSVRAGDIDGMRSMLDSAVQNDDFATIAAYVNKLAESSNPGIHELRTALRGYEANGSLAGETLSGLKQFINASSSINSGAEDIGTWSRSEAGVSLVSIAEMPTTWNEMTPVAFASMKKSSQIEAFRAKGVSPAMAEEILNNPGARGSLKPSVRTALEQIKNNQEPTILNPSQSAGDDE